MQRTARSFVLSAGVAAVMCLTSLAMGAPHYRQYIIPTPSGTGVALGINDLGEVVGASAGRAFIWSQARGYVELSTPSSFSSEAFDVNNDGVVAGATLSGSLSRAVRWTAPDQLQNLGIDGTAHAINRRGDVVGTTLGTPAAFSWTEAEGMRLLGTLGGLYSYAYDINDRGDIVGSASVANGETHAYLWTREDGMVDLGTLGGSYSQAQAINNRREVVGIYAVALTFETRAFRWTRQTGMVDIGISPASDGINSFGQDINDLGLVAGYIFPANTFGHAGVWRRSSGWTDLTPVATQHSLGQAINLWGAVAGHIVLDGTIFPEFYVYQPAIWVPTFH